MKRDVYIALGGNIGDTAAIFDAVLKIIGADLDMDQLSVSQYYKTSPVGPIPQSDYLNAVCRVCTSLELSVLFQKLSQIEKNLGKLPKAKDAPRVIDLDILFYGNEECVVEGIEVPHPRWKERLFVLQPLSELTDRIEINGTVFDIHQMKTRKENFPGQHIGTL